MYKVSCSVCPFTYSILERVKEVGSLWAEHKPGVNGNVSSAVMVKPLAMTYTLANYASILKTGARVITVHVHSFLDKNSVFKNSRIQFSKFFLDVSNCCFRTLIICTDPSNSFITYMFQCTCRQKKIHHLYSLTCTCTLYVLVLKPTSSHLSVSGLPTCQWVPTPSTVTNLATTGSSNQCWYITTKFICCSDGTQSYRTHRAVIMFSNN